MNSPPPPHGVMVLLSVKSDFGRFIAHKILVPFVWGINSLSEDSSHHTCLLLLRKRNLMPGFSQRYGYIRRQ